MSFDAAEKERTCSCGRPAYKKRLICLACICAEQRVRYEQRRGDRPRFKPDLLHTSKVCRCCGIEKPVANFTRRLKAGVHVGYETMCKPCDKARTYAWRKANPEKWLAIALYGNKERQDRKRAGGWGRLPRGAWSAIVEFFGSRCAYCLVSLVAPTRDHVQPLSRGGSHSVDNVVPACGSCNSSKQDKTLLEWMIFKHGGLHHAI